jgi:hypothetical protein
MQTGRQRTIYAITDEGRQALQVWLDEPSQKPSFKIEFLLKLAFLEQGNLKSFLARLHESILSAMTAGRSDVIRRAAVNPQLLERVHLSAHMADLIGRINRTYTDWFIELEADAEVWESIGTTPERQAAGKEHY